MLFAQKAQAPDPKLQKYKARLAAAKHDTVRMKACVDISTYFRYVQTQNDSALVYALKAEQIADKYPNYPKVVRVWNCLGVAYKLLNENTIEAKDRQYYYDQAQIAFNKCIQKAKQLGDEEFLKRAWFNNNMLFSGTSNKYPFFLIVSN